MRNEACHGTAWVALGSFSAGLLTAQDAVPSGTDRLHKARTVAPRCLGEKGVRLAVATRMVEAIRWLAFLGSLLFIRHP
jgi:hypothetical protein